MRIRFDTRQTELLTRRARLRGTSLSEKVRDAVDFYLEIPEEIQDELQEVAVEANRAADRMLKRLDETIARVDRVRLEMNARRRPGMLAGKSRE